MTFAGEPDNADAGSRAHHGEERIEPGGAGTGGFQGSGGWGRAELSPQTSPYAPLSPLLAAKKPQPGLRSRGPGGHPRIPRVARAPGVPGVQRDAGGPGVPGFPRAARYEDGQRVQPLDWDSGNGHVPLEFPQQQEKPILLSPEIEYDALYEYGCLETLAKPVQNKCS